MGEVANRNFSRNLLWGEEASDVLVHGFLPKEPGTQWRWAHGHRQSISFRPFPGHQRISYRLQLLRPGAELEIQLPGGSLRKISSGAMSSGSFEFFCSDEEAESPLTLTFVSTWNNDLSCDLPEGFVFAVHSLRHMADDGSIAKLKREPAEILASNQTPPFFCAYPFVALFLNQDGKSFPCCYSESRASGFSGDAIETVRADGEEAIAKAWNSPLMRATRKQMLNGRVPAVCGHCQKLERNGADSPRGWWNSRWQEPALIKAKTVDRDGHLSGSPLVLEVQQGNKCNLKCRMCGPRNSVGLIEEHGELVGGDLNEFRKNFWLKNTTVIKDLSEQASDIQELAMVGGEPLLTEEYFSLLERYIEDGKSRNIALTLNTNLTVLPEKVATLFRRFREVRMQVSIDGYKEVNDFIRHPSKFAVIEKNLQTIYSEPARWNLGELTFNTTVQVYNLFHLIDLFEYLETTFPRLQWFPNLRILTEPKELSVLILPKEVRFEACEKLGAYLNRKGESSSLMRERISSVCDYLKGPSEENLLPEFYRRHRIANKLRNQEIPFKIPGLF